MKLDFNILNNKIYSSVEINKLLTNNLSGNNVTFINPSSALTFVNYPYLIDYFDYIFVDGISLVLLHNFFNKNKIDRNSFDFTSFATGFFDFHNENKKSVCFIGATTDEIDIFVKRINLRYNNINIPYYRNGYFIKHTEYDICFSHLSSLNPDAIVVGMGSPHQEKFIASIRDFGITKPNIYTCGGFMTQTSLRDNYYPPIVDKLSLRWLQRIILHKHVRDRFFRHYPNFFFQYLYHNIFNKT